MGSSADAAEILAHQWFSDIDLAALESLEISPPIVPSQDNYDTMQYFKTRRKFRETILTENQEHVIQQSDVDWRDFDSVNVAKN